MQTNDEIRRARLAMLIAEAGSAAKFAERAGKAPPQISQWVNASPDSKTKRPRTMSDDAARELEERLGLPRGWMDQPVEPCESSVRLVCEPRSEYSVTTLPDALPVVLTAIAGLDPEARDSVLATMKAYKTDSPNAGRALAYVLGELSGGANNSRVA